MSVTEQRITARVWSFGVRQVVYSALGAALYGALSVATNWIQLPSAGNISLRPAIVIPLFFGVVFNPIVGFFVGLVGNILGDLISYHGFYWNWDLGNGLIGFIAGLAIFATYGRYNNTRNIIYAEIFAAVGVIVGIAFAALNEIYLSKISFGTTVLENFVPAAIPDLINGLILLPIVLVAYNAAVNRSGRG